MTGASPMWTFLGSLESLGKSSLETCKPYSVALTRWVSKLRPKLGSNAFGGVSSRTGRTTSRLLISHTASFLERGVQVSLQNLRMCKSVQNSQSYTKKTRKVAFACMPPPTYGHMPRQAPKTDSVRFFSCNSASFAPIYTYAGSTDSPGPPLSKELALCEINKWEVVQLR